MSLAQKIRVRVLGGPVLHVHVFVVWALFDVYRFLMRVFLTCVGLFCGSFLTCIGIFCGCIGFRVYVGLFGHIQVSFVGHF